MAKFLLFFFIVFIVILPSTYSFTCTLQQYQAFLDNPDYNPDKQKWSDNQTEFDRHFKLFCQRKEQIEIFNSQNHSYTKKTYRFMDREQEQVKKYFSVGSVPVNLFSVSSQWNQVKSVGVAPASVDYRSTGKVSSIKDQGTCGCCWSFVTTGLYESWMMFKGENQYDLSEQYILECTNDYTANILGQNYVSNCKGGYVDFAGQLARRNGIPLQTAYPYKGKTFTGNMPSTTGICETNSTYMYARDPTVTTFTINRNLTNDQMKNLIAAGPIGALIYADSGFQSYSTGTYSGCPAFATSYNKINHAVIIVGYDSSGNYIVKNSWSTTWGQSGFGVVSKDFDCGLSAFAYQFVSNASPGGGLEYSGQVKFTKKYQMSLTKLSLLVFAIMLLFV